MVTSYVTQPVTVLPPDLVYRVARSGAVLRLSSITPTDAGLDGAGNRFDVVGGGVLYAATNRQTCFAETLARFRVPAAIRAVVEEMDTDGRMICGGIAADWRARRVAAQVRIEDPLPFLDVTQQNTHEFLTAALADELARYDLEAFDNGVVQGRNRLLTRAIATWAYTQTDSEGYLYGGIRYKSRLDGEECWAIFDGSQVSEVGLDPVLATDPDLIAVADTFGLRVF